MFPSINNHTYKESLSIDEHSQLKAIFDREVLKLKVVLYRLCKIFLGVFLIVAAIVSISYHFTPEEDLLLPNDERVSLIDIIITIFISLLVICGVLSIIFFIAYWINVRPIRKDIQSNYKIIETVSILQKQYMQHINAYYFTINSKQRLSLQVTKEEYEYYKTGDEISLEYTPHARIDLGYH